MRTLPLSQREQDIALMVAHGQTSKEIARALKISPRTVETHRSNILHKLQAKNSADLVRKVIQ
jgi:DNA-binding CsgD family transcriptional regulator